MTEVKYLVCYRTGGEAACEWRRVLGIYNKGAAAITAGLIAKMGYLTLVHPIEHVRAHGLPIGWDAKCVDWENDLIEVERDQHGMMRLTTWRRAA